MDYVEARQLVRIRQELRDHLAAERLAEAQVALERLRAASLLDPSLRGEYQRWCVRFALLGVDTTAAAA
jgi:hypothetical protein